MLPASHPNIDTLIRNPVPMPDWHPAMDPWLSYGQNTILAGPTDQ